VSPVDEVVAAETVVQDCDSVNDGTPGTMPNDSADIMAAAV
jgi:hypothetical protein